MTKFLSLIGLLMSCAIVTAKGFPDFPYSKEMDVLIVANDMQVNGIRMRAFQFKTSKDEAHIVDFYKGEWGEEMTDVLFGDWRILSHRDGDYLLTVQIEQGDHQLTHGTMGITPAFKLAEQSDRKLAKLQKSVGKDFPMLPSSQVISDIRSEDLGQDSQTLMFSNKQSIRQNVNFYLRKMMSDGWQLLGSNAEQAAELGAFALNKGEQKMNLSFVRDQGVTYGVAVTLK
ncbi:hypothetical protein [Arenicella xantha]|nr:hypothetical protein [Arenicella xantha]